MGDGKWGDNKQGTIYEIATDDANHEDDVDIGVKRKADQRFATKNDIRYHIF